MPLHGIFRSVDIAASAMGAEQLRMTAASENMANAGATQRLEDGLPYKRQRVHFESVLDERSGTSGQVAARVVESPKYIQRYAPDHPDADAAGMVIEADIDPVLEFTDLMIASRAYDANSNMVRGLMRMHEQALRLGEG